MKRIYQIHFFCIILSIFISLLFSCNKQAPTVNPGDYTSGAIGAEPGYFYPFVTAVYPANGSTNIPLDTKYIIVFNMPIDTSTLAGNITATTTPLPSPPGLPVAQAFTISSTANNPVIELTFTGSLAGNNRISVSLTNGILDQGGTIPINNPGTWTFDTGTAPDTIDPTITLAPDSRIPVNGSINVSLTAPGIQLDFSEAINPSTINSTTFYLERTVPGPTTLIPTICSWSPAAAPTTATLTLGAALEPSSTYRVTVTTGMTDLAGRTLSAGTTWTFTTADGDPDAGAPTVTSGPSVVYVNDTTAGLSWTTDEATNFTLNYGQGDNLSLAPIIDSVYSTSHYYLLGNPLGSPASPALSPGRRYYFNINYADFIGNSAGPTPVTPIEFNTETSEGPLTIDSSTNNQTGLNWITRKADVVNTGAFMTWRYFTPGSPGYYSIYGQRYDNTLTAEWNTTNPLPAFTELNQSYTFSSMVEDGLGGMILTALRGNEVRVKRFDSTGAIVNYGAGTLPTSFGLQIDSGTVNTYASAVPVSSGIFTQIGPIRTTDMEALGLLNPFVDYNVDLSGLTDGYIIMDPNNHDGTTIDNNSVAQDYRNILGQDSNIIASGDTYYIADNATTATFTAQDHVMHSGTNYNNGGNTVYTEHNVSPGWLGVNDIIRNGANYGRITVVTPRTVSPLVGGTGTESADRTNHLIDGGATWNTPGPTLVSNGDLAERTVGAAYAVITNVTDTDLTLSSDIYPGGSENYAIHGRTDSGTATSYSLNQLNDSSATWNTVGPTQVFVGDIVIRTNATFDTVEAVAYVVNPVISNTSLDLSAEIFPVGNENYIIYKQGNIDSGTANPNRTLHLIDGGAAWTSAPVVAIGDLVVNTSGGPTYAFVTAVSATDLTIDNDIFSGAGNDNYAIYRNYCTTHSGAPSIQSFLELTVNWAINVANGQAGVTLYDYIGVTGTADTLRTNPLYDDGVDLSAAAANDIVLNYTDGTWTYVNNITYAASGALGLNANIMSDGDTYSIIRGNNGVFAASNIIDIGSAQGGTVGTTLVTDGIGLVNGPIAVGDIAYNYTDNDYAMVTNAAGATLTLTRNAGFGVGDRYVIVRGTGVLYAWYNGTNVRASIRSIADGTTLRPEYTLVAGATNPYMMSDGNGNAYLIYISGGNLRAGLYNAAGNAIWTSGIIDPVTAIHKVISDNNGGVIVLYQNGGTMYARQIRNNLGAYQSPWNGSIVTGAPTSLDIVCNSTGTNVIITGEVGGDIYAWRRGGTTWTTTVSAATGTQQNPRIFVNAGWTTATIVWEDDRFYSIAGYGIFGMKVEAATGNKHVEINGYTPPNSWRANASGTNDYNGVSVMLNSGNKYWPLGLQIVTYNNGADGALIWEDWRNINDTLPYNGSDLLYIDIEEFTPY